MIEEGVLQRHHMIACLRRENPLHLPQGSPLGKEDEEGVLQNPVRFLGKERRRSPSPKVVSPESPKVLSKKSKKSGKKEKKDSKGSRRTERVEPVQDRTSREERSRSTRRPESPPAQRPQAVQIEVSETDEHPSRDERQLAIQDRPARTRPRFDPSRDLAAAQRIIDKRRVVQPPREHRRDPTTDGPPDSEEEQQRRRRPPPPPPATSTRQAQSGHRALAFARPPLRRDSATESSQVPSERQPLRLRIRSQETPPQRPMPKRVVATPVGGSAPPRVHATPGHATRGDYYDQSQVRDDRAYGSQYQQERQDWGSSRRVPSMGHRESAHAWSGQQYSSQRYQDWSQQPPSTQERWHDPQQDYQQYYPQQSSAGSALACAATATITATTVPIVTGTCFSTRNATKCTTTSRLRT